MPYLRMFLKGQPLDEVFISEAFLNSVLGKHFLEEEKNILMQKNASKVKDNEADISFDLDAPANTSI